MSKKDKEKVVVPINDDDFGYEYGDNIAKIDVISTGSLTLDVLLNGGFHPGFIQLWGPNAIGKTTLALQMAARYQKFYNYENVRVVYHSVEGRWNDRLLLMVPDLLQSSPTKTFIDPKDKKEKPLPIFFVNRPTSGEQMYGDILKRLSQENVKYFHIVDCVDNIKSEANFGKTISDAEKTASIASLNTRFGREASNIGNNFGHAIVLIHQVRDKIQTQGQSHVSGVGKKRSGGHMVEHIANLRLLIEKGYPDFFLRDDPNNNKSKVIGHIMSITLDKVSTSGNRFDIAPVPFIYDKGIDRIREIADLSEGFGLVKKKGAFYAYEGENIAQGQKQFIKYLTENKEFAQLLETKIKETANI
jgi:recombination protein RecA